jgi:uncharacterized surface protein with fasciclin (FAS1) repeats
MARKITIAAACLIAAACSQGGDQTSNGAGTANQTAGGGTEERATIAKGLATAAGHGSFVNALKAAGLEPTLSGAQPYTVFAPTDSAFGKLEGGADALTAPENKTRLVALLTGHIVPGTVTARDLRGAIERGKGKAEIATVGAGTLVFTQSGDFILVEGPDGNQGQLGAETLQSNGVVHSLDTVLMPK